MKVPHYLAALSLFLLPAISVELLTGDTPLPTFLGPIVFILLNVTYGGALLLLRETVARWHKGFVSVLVLAAGYGMTNEAIDTKGFFDPHFYAVVPNGLEAFGRVFGINVPWALNISIYHAVFSMIVPLVIVSTIFPGKEPWIGNKLYSALLVLLVAVSLFSFFAIALPPDKYHYNEGPGPILLVLSLILFVILLAWKIPNIHIPKWDIHPPAVLLFILGVLYTIVFDLTPGIVHKLTNSPTVYELFLLLFFVLVPIGLISKLPEPSPRGKLALAFGLLVPMLAIALFVGPGGIIAGLIVLTLISIGFMRGREIPVA